MRRLTTTALLAAAMGLATVAPAFPHHSHAMFDFEKEITLTGTVKEFVFRNPHAYLYIDVKTDATTVVNYSIEMSNLTNTIQRGIRPTTFKPGDAITVRLHPLIDGRPGGSYVTITAADGKVYE
jgi:hypothetical protein